MEKLDEIIEQLFEMAKILKQKIINALNSPVPMYNPVPEYTQIIKALVEAIETKLKYSNIKTDKSKLDIAEILDKLENLRESSENQRVIANINNEKEKI